ncbi:polyprenal reductase isoform X2 [Augochlora pura]
MYVNLISMIFFYATLFTGIVGLLITYVESYLPVLITRSYRYGKFSDNTYQKLVVKTEVPKRWFKHFYVFATSTSSYVLYLIFYKYLYNGNIPESVIWLLNICLGRNRQSLVSPENTFVVALVFTIHCWKRFYETHYINIFSDQMMNISHYIIGFYHYFGTLVCIIGESEGFVEGSESNFSWKNISYTHIICGFIIMLSSYAQFRANCILSGLRKDKTDKINSTAYKIPHGGLFEYVSAWVITNQISTAVLTHKWYIQKFQNYPKSRKILLPYIF